MQVTLVSFSLLERMVFLPFSHSLSLFPNSSFHCYLSPCPSPSLHLFLLSSLPSSLPPSLTPSFLPSFLHTSKGPGPIQPQMTLKKLNWKRQNLTPLAGGSSAIWKELPKVEVPTDKFSHLFAQRTIIKEKEVPVSASLRVSPGSHGLSWGSREHCNISLGGHVRI